MSSTGAQAVKKQNTMKFQSAAGNRIQSELAEITKYPPPNCSVKLKGDDLFKWVATIQGPGGSLYEDGVFTLDIHFTKEHPFKPPKVTFKTKIWHCNIGTEGQICLDILKEEKWSPAITVSTLLLSIYALMLECNPHDPLVNKIATVYLQDKKEHDRVAKEWTRKYAAAV